MPKPLSNFIYLLLRVLGGNAFSDKSFSLNVLLKSFFWQKIIRINSHVPWPVHKTSIIKEPKKIDRGTRCPGLSFNVYLDGRNEIKFGKNVWVGPGVRIISMNHKVYDFHKYHKQDGIRIGDNCWIGANAIILPGVSLANHVIVGAGSIVTKSFEEDNIIIAGNPAKKIKAIGDYGKSAKS